MKRKEKRKEGEPSVAEKKAPTRASGAKKAPKQPRVKLSSFGWSVAEWFEPLRSNDVYEPVLPGLNVPLQAVEPSAEEMSRRNIPRPVIPTKTTNSAKVRGISETQREKR